MALTGKPRDFKSPYHLASSIKKDTTFDSMQIAHEKMHTP